MPLLDRRALLTRLAPPCPQITDCITEDSGVLTITCPTIIDINNAQPVAVEIRNGGGLTVTGATNLGLTNISSPDASDALTVKAGTGNAAAFTGTTTFSSQADETDAITLVQVGQVAGPTWGASAAEDLHSLPLPRTELVFSPCLIPRHHHCPSSIG